MRILGIDPGFGRIGYGIIEGAGTDWRSVDFGCIETTAKTPFVHRLLEIDAALHIILAKYTPDHAAVEELFFYKNVTTAMNVSQARGVVLVTLGKAGIPVEEYTPLEIKNSIVGYGRAEKAQVQRMIAMQLGLPNEPIQDDAADALAVALTCGLFLRKIKI